jgi:IS605 OrfB family transposase
VNIPVEVPKKEARKVVSAVGIDLGLKTLATLSNGEKIEPPKFFRKYEKRLSMAKRANKKRLARSIHAKIKNCRKDFTHKVSTNLVKRFDWIAVGDVSPSKLSKTSFSKSVHDAGWAILKNQLRYKAIAHGAVFKEVNESYSSQVCSSCGCLPHGRPEGIADLGIRQWTCGDCGASHDRDINSAINILVGSGRRTLAEGTLAAFG